MMIFMEISTKGNEVSDFIIEVMIKIYDFDRPIRQITMADIINMGQDSNIGHERR